MMGFRAGLILCCVVVGFGGCSKPGPEIVGAEVVANPSGNVPLAAVCRFTTSAPATAVLTVRGGSESFTVTGSGAASTEHEVAVLGLWPGTSHEITIAVTGEDGGRTVSAPLTLITSAIPANFPPIEVTVSEPDRMEPGLTLIPFMKWPEGRLNNDYGLLVAIDVEGRIRWYYTTDHTFTEVRRRANGNIIYQRGRSGYMYEIDMLGNVLHEWHTTGVPKDDVSDSSIAVETDTFHHDFVELENGNIVTLSTEIRHFEEYPSSETNPDAEWRPSNVIGDVIIEMTRDGEILREHKLLDILDPYRIAYDSLGTGFWADVFKEVVDRPGRDWTHTNSIYYIAEEDAVLLSMYHQDAVVKLDMETGEIIWILGTHEGWKEPWSKYLLTPKGELEWQYGQHAAKRTPHGTVILFDNGTHRAFPPAEKMQAEDSYSRAVEYRIDEETMEVEQVWVYGGLDGERFFSPFICDVDWLPEQGNILVTDGGRIRDKETGDVSSQVMGGHHWARIAEVTHSTPPEKVFEVVIDDDWPNGWAVYRSERISGLYPD